MTGRTALLDQAISYAAGAVSNVTPEFFSHSTPCRAWNLEMLLTHLCESLTTLHSGIVTGQVDLFAEPAKPSLAMDPALVFHDRADLLLTARDAVKSRRHVDIADRPIPGIALECAGAIEIAVHGWDVSQACGHCRPIPDALAAGLLAVAPLYIPETGRSPLFDVPVKTALHVDLGDQLVAYLGRNPIPGVFRSA
jgi:uncharacterized protein (TIGR03086 family)